MNGNIAGLKNDHVTLSVTLDLTIIGEKLSIL